MTQPHSKNSSAIGIFGGSFDPPHVGHLMVAEHICDRFDLDRVVWVPGYIPPHKQDIRLSSPADRMEMVQRAIAGNPKFEVSDIEIRREGVSFTADTLEQIKKTDPSAELRLLLGGDSFAGFETWYKPEKIVSLAQLIVYERLDRIHERTDRGEHSMFVDHAQFADGPPIEISSTMIRQLVRVGHSVRYLVPDRVLAYIEQRGLYK